MTQDTGDDIAIRCPVQNCLGVAEFSRIAIGGASTIHTCGECGYEWGSPTRIQGRQVTCGASISKTTIIAIHPPEIHDPLIHRVLREDFT